MTESCRALLCDAAELLEEAALDPWKRFVGTEGRWCRHCGVGEGHMHAPLCFGEAARALLPRLREHTGDAK